MRTVAKFPGENSAAGQPKHPERKSVLSTGAVDGGEGAAGALSSEQAAAPARSDSDRIHPVKRGAFNMPGIVSHRGSEQVRQAGILYTPQLACGTVTSTTALRLSVAAVASVLAWAPPAHAQAPSAPTALALRAVRLAKAPVIDGAVKDDEWAGAARADTFVQFEPRRGEPASRRTEAFVAYDATHLYVAFRCFDDEPLTARRTQRDGRPLRGRLPSRS